MLGRSRLAAILTGIALAGVAGCGQGSAEVFHPAGSLAPPAQPGTLGAADATAPGGFRFPAGVSIRFSPALPASAARRAIVTGYQNYVLALWAAVLTHGRDAAYQRLAAGNAAAFVRREAAYFTSHHQGLAGTIRYSAVSVGTVYFGNGATVTSCVDASAFHTTGPGAGPVFPPRYAHYLEEVAEGRRAGGTWYVAHTESYPASTGKGAMCR
jgi:hypothetical protein